MWSVILRASVRSRPSRVSVVGLAGMGCWAWENAAIAARIGGRKAVRITGIRDMYREYSCGRASRVIFKTAPFGHGSVGRGSCVIFETAPFGHGSVGRGSCVILETAPLAQAQLGRGSLSTRVLTGAPQRERSAPSGRGSVGEHAVAPGADDGGGLRRKSMFAGQQVEFDVCGMRSKAIRKPADVIGRKILIFRSRNVEDGR